MRLPFFTECNALRFISVVSSFLLLLRGISWFGHATVCLTTYWMAPGLIPILDCYKQSCYEHSHSTFYMSISFHFCRINAQNSDCWAVCVCTHSSFKILWYILPNCSLKYLYLLTKDITFLTLGFAIIKKKNNSPVANLTGEKCYVIILWYIPRLLVRLSVFF